MPPKRKKKAKEGIIPSLNFVGSLPSDKVPYNDEYIPCSRKHPRVRTVASEEQPPWIEPHFNYSKASRHPTHSTSAFNDNDPFARKRKSKSLIGPLDFLSDGSPTAENYIRSPKSGGKCPLFPLVTPKPPRQDAKILVPESPEH